MKEFSLGIIIMHESLWAGSARIIIPADAFAGIVLNIGLLVVLCQTDIGQSARVYRITCMITAVLGIYFSLLLLLIQHVYIFIDGNVADVLYGPILYYLPERVNDILITAFFTQAHTLWQFLPGPSIVQWIHLTKPEMSVSRQLLLAYTVPVICNVNTWYFMSFNIPDETLRKEMINSISRLHGSDPRDYHCYGTRFIDKGNIDLLAMIMYDVLPSYIVCYGLFSFCAIKIRIDLKTYLIKASAKTALMQQRFFRLQLVQVFMPVVLSAIPISVALMATLGGLNLANISFLLCYSMYLQPSTTASLFLLFVYKSSTTQRKELSFSSTSKVEPMERVQENR